MKALFRILGTAAAVAVTGAAIVVLDKILNDKAPLHVEAVEFPEDAENDAEEAAKTAQAYAEGEAKAEKAAAPAEPETPTTATSSTTPAEEAAPAEPAAEQETAPAAPADSKQPAFDPDAPNPNPVEAGPAVAPKDESGKFDPTKIADASDFGDWEEQGCKG